MVFWAFPLLGIALSPALMIRLDADLQREQGAQPPTLNSTVSALRFFFTVMLDRPDLFVRRRRVRRPPEEGREPRHEPDVIALGIRSQAAQGPCHQACAGAAA